MFSNGVCVRTKCRSGKTNKKYVFSWSLCSSLWLVCLCIYVSCVGIYPFLLKKKNTWLQTHNHYTNLFLLLCIDWYFSFWYFFPFLPSSFFFICLYISVGMVSMWLWCATKNVPFDFCVKFIFVYIFVQWRVYRF